MKDKKISDAEAKQIAPRHQVNLRSSVLITALAADESEDYYVLQGQLLDVSVSGLALIISNDDMLKLNELGDELKLRLLLPLPAQAIELEAVPVRYQKLNEGKAGKILLGAQITDMSGRDRILFMDFIHQYEN